MATRTWVKFMSRLLFWSWQHAPDVSNVFLYHDFFIINRWQLVYAVEFPALPQVAPSVLSVTLAYKPLALGHLGESAPGPLREKVETTLWAATVKPQMQMQQINFTLVCWLCSFLVKPWLCSKSKRWVNVFPTRLAENVWSNFLSFHLFFCSGLIVALILSQHTYVCE